MVNSRDVQSLDDLASLLRRMRATAGNPSFRDIQRRARDAGERGQPVPSLSTVHGYFRNGRARMDTQVVLAIAAALGAGRDELQAVERACRAVLDRFNRSRIVSTAGAIPAPSGTFAGRDAERRRIAGLAGERAKRPVVVAIEGMAGIGKTELALRAVADLARDGHDAAIRLYVNLRGYDRREPPADSDAVIRGFLGHLGVPNYMVSALNASGRLARYRELLNGQNAVVVLDNAADVAQVKPLLPNGCGAVVLVTSRRRLAGLDAVRLPLDVLRHDDALELLSGFDAAGRVGRQPRAAEDLVDLCRGLPLELVAVGGQLAARPGWELGDHVERLRRIPPSQVSRPALAVSYAGLSALEQRVFRQLSVHPGREYSPDAVTALTGLSRDEIAAALRRLSDEHLLTHRPPEHYEFHDSIRAYSRLLADSDEPASAQRAALTRLIEHYLARLADYSEVDLDWFLGERPNLLACVQAAEPGESTVALTRATHAQLRLLGHYEDARWCAEQLRRVARVTGDASLEAEALANLADIDRLTGDHDAAAASLTEVLAIRTELGDRKGQADALRGLAQTIVGRDFATAARRYEQALRIHREIGNPVGEAENLWGLVEIDLNLGANDIAASRARRVIDICERLDHRLGQAYGHSGLAMALTGVGELDEATAHFRKAWDVCEQIGNRRGGAFVLRNWALAELAAADHDAANARLGEALAICVDIGDRLGEAESACGLGDVALAAGEVSAAGARYEHALRIYRDIHDRPWQAQALRGLGNVAAARGEATAAAGHRRQALALAEPFGLPMVAELRAALDGEGD